MAENEDTNLIQFPVKFKPIIIKEEEHVTSEPVFITKTPLQIIHECLLNTIGTSITNDLSNEDKVLALHTLQQVSKIILVTLASRAIGNSRGLGTPVIMFAASNITDPTDVTAEFGYF
jgi:hypothetical protein